MGRKSLPQKLLVEGKDDQHVIWALCQKFGLAQTFEVIDSEGIEELLQEFPVRLKEGGTNTVGVIIDADTNLAGRWQSLKDILSKAGYTVPDELPQTGLIISAENQKRFGAWIMPDNHLNGMLEDFIQFLVPVDDQLLPMVKDHLTSIESRSLHKYAGVHRAKALVHAWLALQESPGTPMGQAITKRYLSTDQQTCQNFINWLTELFENEAA